MDAGDGGGHGHWEGHWFVRSGGHKSSLTISY